ncbi:BMP family ABC transporter substrate-binding protein [Halalkalibacillus sediminis]|uniref:BMP family ABC transporter substrate-binding protein n=1 Tax=Halalkalibacillus sediminis TaxID=2018042 RepID=A0A2I0QWK1_9BACI|nr:BMP family protein [Halalkalibacillus sediminis]PKR78679.1 BMP family ABC transporter substrate-binding protein [Halalkalibacillus sediminis]
MKMRNFLMIVAMLFALSFVLVACGSSDDSEEGSNGDDTSEETDSGDSESSDEESGESSEEGSEGESASGDFSAAMVTDVGGVDDKSFNQSAWEGLQAFGDENGLTEGDGYAYAQSNSNGDYEPNLTRLTKQGYNLVFGIGFKLTDAITKVAQQNPDTNYALVDAVSEAENVANIVFKEHQGSFLAGVAAANKTESKQVGFVGGIDSPLINKFEAGFEAGVKSVDSSIEVEVQYAESFDDAARGRQIASSMYNSGIDVIYHAAGGAGNGVFNEAKDIKNNDPEAYVWVIGVDRDQYEEGAVTVDGTDYNVTLTSMVKRVDNAVVDVSTRAMEGDFPGGETIEYGLEDEGVSIARTNEEAFTEEIGTAVDEWQQKILDGEVEVPSTREDLETFLSEME